jgi:hypothetical protein
MYFVFQSAFYMFRFSLVYFLSAILLVALDLLIVNHLHDAVIRPYGGDFLWGIFLYCLVKSFSNLRVGPAVLGVFVFCCFEEVLQYFHFADWLGFTKPSLMRTLIGTTFSLADILTYGLGLGVVFVLEKIRYETICST